ncbi:hypothetical protein VOLCADRAFT_90676 [Volvox carteri f. nagariensis]|uniref:Uncharacterized protein n=1 Tax=Volvox carteri f. nagariensis TaxID=3068 RepID=D8TVF2_VOLCA|nr:uncharacterized protein VOLCADRAFT_90676 [Volvox carteri f. nagariensis]EFJ48449.1 hypothetical protein VOLCADRAFT_90676 [Volvox carteri f. nagariensis]|eukprot:XP_002950248.1 hypothetical protein VOLCADRAFT_90676 [Volvox carteri f. nagariensis]
MRNVVAAKPSPGGSAASPAAAAANAAVATSAVPLFVHLTELDLTGSGNLAAGGLLAVEKLQEAAPNLRILRLDATGSMASAGVRLSAEPGQPGPGFPQLRVCELGLSRTDQILMLRPSRRYDCTCELLRRVVGASPLLHTLDVSGNLSIDDQLRLDQVRRVAEMRLAECGLDVPFPSATVFCGDAVANAAYESSTGEAAAEWYAVMRTAIAAETAALSVVVHCGGGEAAAVPNPQNGFTLRRQLLGCLGLEFRASLVGPLRVLRASRSLLASDAALHALAARFGGTLQLLDVSESLNVTDAGLLHIARSCTALTSLDVSGTAITDFGLRVLLALRYTGPGCAGAQDSGPASSADTAARSSYVVLRA